MNQDLDILLYKKYPKLFESRFVTFKDQHGWGFEIDDGWFNIVDMLCTLIQLHVNHTRMVKARAIRYNRALTRAVKRNDINGLIWFYNASTTGVIPEYTIKRAEQDRESPNYKNIPEACPQVIVDQVKEKFGSLRFYYHGGDEYVAGLVDMAEAMSSCTCEKCGNPGNIEGSGWIKTLCNNCRSSTNDGGTAS